MMLLRFRNVNKIKKSNVKPGGNRSFFLLISQNIIQNHIPPNTVVDPQPGSGNGVYKIINTHQICTTMQPCDSSSHDQSSQIAENRPFPWFFVERRGSVRGSRPRWESHVFLHAA